MTPEELEAARRDIAIIAEFEAAHDHNLPGLGNAEWRIAHVHAQKLLADLARVTAERDEMGKVVEKLPKTLDGVPIHQGLKVWYVDYGSPDCGIVKSVRKAKRDDTRGPMIVFQKPYPSRFGGAMKTTGVPLSQCFSTKEAALASSDQRAGGE